MSHIPDRPTFILYHGPTYLFHEPKPGVIVPVVPDSEHPEYTTYCLRDACLITHTWLNQLTEPGPHDDTKQLRSLVDDSVRALVRTQQVVSLAGNVFTGGLEEAFFDIHLGKITDPASRPGSPAAGTTSASARYRRVVIEFSQMGRLSARRY